jgi:hypothetical protein
MDHARRMRIAGAAISAVHLACGLLGWLAFGVPGSLLLFGMCAAISLGLAVITAPLLQRPPRDDGGLGVPRPTSDPPPDPPWWPEFERDFRAHAARERTRA